MLRLSIASRWEALVVVALILHWCIIEEVSATSEPLISFANQTEEIPNVLILNTGQGQFVLDDLNVTLATSIPDNETTLQLDIVLVNDTSFAEINIDEPAARAEGRIPLDLRFDYSYRSLTQTITVRDLDVNTTIFALRSLTYSYSSNIFPESVSNNSSDLISITLTQDNINSTISFTVQYRGVNVAPPVLSYNQTGDNVTYTEGDEYVYIINGTVIITDNDHPSYLLQSASVEIVNYNSEDQLSVMNGTLASTYGNGVLTITGPASVEEFQAAINNIVYSNTVDEPLSDVKMITINVTDSPVFNTDSPTNNPLMIANSSTSNMIEIIVIVVNVDELPNPILNNLYLTEETGPVKINLTTVDSTDPLDNYTNASLVLTPTSSEIESLSFNGPSLPGIYVMTDNYSITVDGLGSKEDYNDIFCNVTYHWSSTNGNLGSGYLTLIVTDFSGNTATVTANISVDDVKDDAPIFGFAADDVDRISTAYPTMLAASKFIEYDTTDPVYFLSYVYLRDDRQLKNITIEVTTNVSTSDRLEWNETLQEELGINYSNTTSELTTLYIFSANISDELEWEMFLMSFSFLQSNMRAADRDSGNRTIRITVQDCNNVITITVVINVIPLPPVVAITLQNIVFVEGQNFTLLRTAFPIEVTQDEDALFTSLTITLQIVGEGNYELGDREMINTVIPPAELQRNVIRETASVHTVEFSSSMGISNQDATQAIQSIVYINVEREPRAFDDTGAPLLREIVISTVDMLSRSFQTSFNITIEPINDNSPVIRLFTAGNCSFNSISVPPRKKRTSHQQSQRIKHHSTLQQEHQMAPHITEIYGDLTDKNCAAYIVIHFSAPISHPYVDIWPRLSLVLSLSPHYLSDQQPTGTWDGQDILIITFPEHNCSEWNYNDSHVTFKQSNDPCHSPIECLTGICYANYSGCRITGTFAFNFTTGHNGQATAVDCLYPPTSAPLLADTWVVNILVATVILLLGTVSFYCIWKYISKRLHVPKEDSAANTPVHNQQSQSVKRNRKRRSNKSSTIAQIASTPVAQQQQVNDVPSVTQNRSHDYHHGDNDRTFLLLHEDDEHSNRLAVEEVGSEKDVTTVAAKTAVSTKNDDVTKPRDASVTSHSTSMPSDNTMISDNSHDTVHINKTDTPHRPVVNDSAFPPDTS